MKTPFTKHHKILITSILICITFTFWIANPTTQAEESGNGLAIDDAIGQSLESVDLPQVEGPLYLQCDLPKTRFFMGERIPITITLYISDLVISNIDKPVLSQPEFLLDEVGNSSQKSLRINGRPYRVIKFHYILSPLKTGVFQLGPIKENCYLASNGYIKRRIMEATTRRIPVKVLALPDKGRPDNFSGAIGNFQLNISIKSGQVLQGEPLTIRMKLSGNGNLQAVSAPILQNTAGLKVYNALKKNELSTSNSSWDQATFEQIAIPLDKRLRQIGPFIFTFFDPNTGKYRFLEVPAIPISVKPNPNYKDDSVFIKPIPQPKLAPIKKELGTMHLKDWLLLQQSLFWLCQLLPLLLLIGTILYRRNAELMQSDSPRARAIRSSNLARQQMAAAQSISNEGRYDDLLDHLHLMLREYLGERFNLAAAGMTGSVVKTLADNGLPPKILKNIRQFFEQYDLHRFAHTNFSQEEAMQLWETVKSIITALDAIDNNKFKPVSKGKE